MAVRAHYGHRQQPMFLAARGGAAPMEMPQAHKDMATMQMQTQTQTPMQQQQHRPLFLDFSGHGDGDGCNGRNRPREVDVAMAQPMRTFSLEPRVSPGPKMISLAQLHKRPATMGLRLDIDEGLEHMSCTSSLLPDELAAQCDQHKNEMDRLIQEHAERLRGALADARRRHYRTLLGAAETAASRRIREKEAEASKAARRGAELEERLARLRAEATAWQAKALADQSTAAALHAQLQQAVVAAQASRGMATDEQNNAAVDDAESGFVDPDRVVEVSAPPPPPSRPCRTCRLLPASTVLLPCRHLCVCDTCGPAVTSTSLAGTAATAACPMCRCPVTGTVQVFFP